MLLMHFMFQSQSHRRFILLPNIKSRSVTIVTTIAGQHVHRSDKILELVKLVINHVDPKVDHWPEQNEAKMNQMQTLLHEALIATHHVENGAIIRRKDVSLRASSAGFSLTNDQMERFIGSFRNPPRTREVGIVFSEKKYTCVRADSSSVYAKHGKTGIVLVKTGSLIIVGTYNENMYPSVCVEAVEKLASYFKEKGK